MPSYYEWTSRKKTSSSFNGCICFEVGNHPLRPNHVVNLKPKTSNSFLEALTKWSSTFEIVDPLLRFEQMKTDEDDSTSESHVDVVPSYVDSWNLRRSAILNKYTTGEKLTIVSSFLPGGEKTLFRQVSNLNEKVKHRLEQLDDFDDGSVRKTMGLSQQEFVTRINMLSDEIKKAWDSEQRVKAFKIGIQCSKLLSDIMVMQFYPSKFVLITDILDTFGDLVFDRLREKSQMYHDIKYITDIDPDQVPEAAKETCQNWFFKMASIRELLPRLYMEMSLLKCYAYLSKDEIKPTIERLTIMIRGIANPLVAVYLRFYLCRVSLKLLGKDGEMYFYNNLKEFLEDYQQIFHPIMKKNYDMQSLPLDKYLQLYVPAVSWLLYGTLNSNKCEDSLIEKLLLQCQELDNSELLLYCIIHAFNARSVTKNASVVLEMVRKSSDNMVLISEILSCLGEHLCNAGSQQQLESETLIQTWWKIVSSMKCTFQFLQVLEPWIQFACLHLSTQHVNIILRGTIRYMVKSERTADEYSGNFLFVVKRILKFVPDVEELFLMDAFMPLMELAQTANARTMMAKNVLSIFFSRLNSLHIEDHIVISSLMRLCCILHDSINAVTVDDEIKVCADLIIKFVQTVSYQDDLEQQLNFYVECRAAFIKLDAVLIALVHAVNKTAAAAASGGRRATSHLPRACAAYCFVTVPSLHCPLVRAQLYLLSGQVALLNRCIGQAEANFKALVGLIPDIPEFILEDGQRKPTHIKVGGIISDFLSTLLMLPDNVDANCKAYILSGFIKMMERIHWKKTEPLYYTTLLRVLDLLCEMTREHYVYHIDAVISNDKLYGSEEEFIKALDKHATNICQVLLAVLKLLGDNKEIKKQYTLALELFWRVVRRGEINKPSMMSLAVNLWILSKKLQHHNYSLAKSILSALKSDPNYQELLLQLGEG